VKWRDLPESQHFVDRRGKRKAETMREQQEEGLSEAQPDRGPPDPTSDLAKKLGVNDVGNS
jgi:hypothetical protein